MRKTRSTPPKAQKPTKKRKKKGHVSNGDITEAEDASSAPPSSSDSLPEPPHSDSEGSDSKSVAEEEDEVEEEDEEEAEEEEVEVVKKKKKSVKHNGKKRKVEAEEEVEEEEAKCLFPMNRIRMIAKSEGGDDMRLSHEAIFLMNKASEKFLAQLCEEAYAETVTVSEKKNYLAYDHLSSSVSKNQRLCFLSDLIPEKITAEEALKERQLADGDPKALTTN